MTCFQKNLKRRIEKTSSVNVFFFTFRVTFPDNLKTNSLMMNLYRRDQLIKRLRSVHLNALFFHNGAGCREELSQFSTKKFRELTEALPFPYVLQKDGEIAHINELPNGDTIVGAEFNSNLSNVMFATADVMFSLIPRCGNALLMGNYLPESDVLIVSSYYGAYERKDNLPPARFISSPRNRNNFRFRSADIAQIRFCQEVTFSGERCCRCHSEENNRLFRLNHDIIRIIFSYIDIYVLFSSVRTCQDYYMLTILTN